jgi:uncharacterized membrane protein YqjE
MNNFIKSIAASFALFIILTIPHLICIFTWGEYGIAYSSDAMMSVGLICGLLGPTLSKKFLN